MYQQPEVVDYGTLVDLTQATGLFGIEDGASKMVPTHHEPPQGISSPSGP